MAFQVGDKVELNSGGPIMTVHEVQSEGALWCVWFNKTSDGWEVKGALFKQETLKEA